MEYTLCKHCGGRVRERNGDWVHRDHPMVAESHGAVPATFVLKDDEHTARLLKAAEERIAAGDRDFAEMEERATENARTWEAEIRGERIRAQDAESALRLIASGGHKPRILPDGPGHVAKDCVVCSVLNAAYRGA